ncbi:phage major capsid protein [Clostridium haemolyticum]|uniref:phage major capsid protein n=1 Tax=Clostridium haemolyticum TaxID=84025 RepID=UPI000689B94F|nr:phage major capsid protein [Clostridium haemolyticum]
MEIKSMIEEMNKTFADLKEAVDKKADPEVVERIQKRLDELEAKSQRVKFGTGSQEGELSEIEKKEMSEFKDYARSGVIGEGLNELNKKAMSSDSSPNGGIFLPQNMASGIITRVRKISPMRQICSTVTISKGNDYQAVREANNAYEYGWVGERQPRKETATDTFESIRIPVHEMYAQPSATQILIDDAAFNIEGYIKERVANRFAQVEGSAFISGDGVKQPEGFLNNKEIEQISGKLDFDGIMNLIYSLDAKFSNGAVLLAKRTSVRDLRLLKDNDGHYLWQPSTQIGEPATILGYKVVEADDMPESKVGNTPIAFGNFKDGYLIVDKAGINFIRDNLTAKPNILFYTTKRVGGGVIRPEAIKVLKQNK